MMTVKIFSAIIQDSLAIPVTLSIYCEDGQGISVSGLITETINRDMKRVQLTLLNCGWGFKRKKLHIDISPSIVDGGDELMLAMAIGILIATGKIIAVIPVENYCIVGGLGVTGNVHEIDAAGAVVTKAMEKDFTGIILPALNIKLINFDGLFLLYPVRHLNDLVNFFSGGFSPKKIALPSTLFEYLNYN